MNIISSPVPLSVCGARLEAAAELEGDARHDVPPVGGMHTCMERAALKWPAVAMKTRASARSSANGQTFIRTPYSNTSYSHRHARLARRYILYSLYKYTIQRYITVNIHHGTPPLRVDYSKSRALARY